MTRTVFCQKHKKEAPGLDRVPYPGLLGQRIYENICVEAWKEWLKHQTLLINENRLNVLSPEARTFIETEMQKFLFEDSAQKPMGYTAPES